MVKEMPRMKNSNLN